MEERELRRYMREAFRNMDQETGHISFEEIAAYSSGKVTAPRSDEMKTHLAGCAECRERLEEFEQFAIDSQTPPAKDLTAEWNALHRRLRPQKKIEVIRTWLPRAAAIILVAGLSWILIQRFSSDPERLLARAYQEQRTSEFRLAHASHGPILQERGGRSAFHQPQSLVKAQAKLLEELASSPDNPDLLRLQGEAEMIAQDATSAIHTLETAVDLRSNDARILADLGAAYALHEDATGGQDYSRALNLLSQSLHIQPQVPEVVFNRALVLEKMMLFDQAIEEWKNYLKVERDGDWAGEARKHLTNLENKLKSREERLHRIQADPAKFIALASTGAQLDVEAYLHNYAITEWLPRSRSDKTARAAIESLAAILKQRGDYWLTDMAASDLGPETLVAIDNLKTAENEIQYGDLEAGLIAARRANHGFLRAGNLAGSFYARLSEVPILKNLAKNEACLKAAENLNWDLNRHPYLQLRARVRIEQAICAMRSPQLKKAAVLLEEAINISEAAGLDATTLEANIRYLSSLRQIGLQSEVFSHAKRCLEIFWAGAHSAALFHVGVDELRLIASNANQQYTAAFLARSAVWAAAAATEDPNHLLREAMARSMLAAKAEQVGEEAEAQANLQLSDQLLAKFPPAYRIEPQVSFAEVELERGQVDGALGRLESLHSRLPLEPSFTTVYYYSILGEACRRKGLLQKAMEAFHQSIALGSQRHLSMATDRERAGILKTIEGSYRGLVAAILSQGDSDSAALEVWQSYRAQDSGINVAEIQSHTGPVLWFIELPDGLVSWLTQNGHTVLHRFDIPKEAMAAVIRRFLRECGDPTGNDRLLRYDAQRLYQWMIAPFADQLTEEDKALVVDLDGIFSAIPIEALVASDGTHLGDRFSITVASSYGAGSAHWALAPSAMAVIVANPVVSGDSAVRFPPLPASLEEADIVRAAFPHNILMKGRNASLAGLAAALPQADLVHFAGHGSTDWEDGALVLTAESTYRDYDLLRSAELQRQNWSRCRLVVLSACATAKGETTGTHNPDSLVRALTKAGASRVLASLWNADSTATAELMQIFYVSLAAGADPDRALQKAQESVRRQPTWKHPYYWAGFQLYGTV